GPDIAEDVHEVVTVEERLTLPTQSLEEIAEARHLLPIAIPEALPEEPLERPPEVAVRDEIVRHRRKEGVGVEVGKRLGSVPAGVAAPHALYRGPTAPRSLLRLRFRCSAPKTNSTAAATRAGSPSAPSRDMASPNPVDRRAWRS